MTVFGPDQCIDAWGLLPEPTHPASATYRRHGYWRGRSIATLLDEAAERNPRRIAVVDVHHGALTYKELRQLASGLAGQLARYGIGQGDVVPLVLPNWQHVTGYVVALTMLGAVPAVIPMTWREHELSSILTLTDARCLVTPSVFRGRDYATMARALQERHPSLETVLTVNGPLAEPAEVSSTAPIAVRGPQNSSVAPPLAALLFTSGSSGEPKGVMHTTDTLGAMNATVAPVLGLTGQDVLFMGAPVGYSAGFIHGIRLAVALGATLVLQDHWDPYEAIELIDAHRATFTLTTPTMLRDLLDAPNLARHRDLLTLKVMMCGGGFVPPELITRAADELPGTFTTRLWGMTEGIGTACRRDAPDDKMRGTDGTPFLSTELRTVSESGTDVEAGTAGELQMRGAQLFRGYFKRPARTKEVFTTNGWFRTGDIAVLDEHGYLTVVGRRKELIIRGGANIAPGEIETYLLADPRVAQCGVIGLPDERLGERVCACVVPASRAHQLTVADVAAVTEAAGLSRQKWPEELLLFDELPTTPAGKIARSALQAQAVQKARRRPRTGER